MHPSEIVLPDVWKDSKATIHSVTRALKDYHFNPFKDMRYAAVAQGVDRRSWIQCFDVLNDMSEIHTIMLPKNLDEVWGYGGRYAAACYLSATGRVKPEKDYHLLGVWTDPIEVYLHAVHNPWIRSLDTALAFHSGYQGVSLKYLAKYGGNKPRRPYGYFDLPHPTLVAAKTISDNMKMLDRWAVGADLPDTTVRPKNE